MKSARHHFTVLKQICDLIPGHLVPKLAREFGVDAQSRSFLPWSHTIAMLFAQLAHALSLNDVVDTLRNHSGVLTTIRGAAPPSRNGLSYANRERNGDMAEALFWRVLEHLHSLVPQFGMGRRYCGFPRRFRRIINVVDSTTIQLVANCMDWAKHRRRKAAAKCHMRLDLQTFLPRFAVVTSAAAADSKQARTVCAGIQAGEVVVFDRAYIDFTHLRELTDRGVFWVTRAKAMMHIERVRENTPSHSSILRDWVIRIGDPHYRKHYPEEVRLIEAVVEVDHKLVAMTFLTNNMEWAARSICDLYKGRWGIEVFFKQLKQTLQLADFLGHNANAVRWQVWTALLAYVLLRFLAYLGQWRHSFARLFTLLRGVLWECLDAVSLLKGCGTAPPRLRFTAAPQQAYLRGFAPS